MAGATVIERQPGNQRPMICLAYPLPAYCLHHPADGGMPIGRERRGKLHIALIFVRCGQLPCLAESPPPPPGLSLLPLDTSTEAMAPVRQRRSWRVLRCPKHNAAIPLRHLRHWPHPATPLPPCAAQVNLAAGFAQDLLHLFLRDSQQRSGLPQADVTCLIRADRHPGLGLWIGPATTHAGRYAEQPLHRHKGHS